MQPRPRQHRPLIRSVRRPRKTGKGGHRVSLDGTWVLEEFPSRRYTETRQCAHPLCELLEVPTINDGDI